MLPFFFKKKKKKPLLQSSEESMNHNKVFIPFYFQEDQYENKNITVFASTLGIFM
jgi:hypothetical protein